ncbi:hypothetical protein AB182_14575 [Phytobacter ursingii]|uniref:Uncharacterized protein n=1 Tax=Phytobacter ursingii TaxID=1972431 RepID=A0AAC8QP83_9ENTR|nr:hypothetical protein AB182_14575 [Phytobacter ursingii]
MLQIPQVRDGKFLLCNSCTQDAFGDSRWIRELADAGQRLRHQVETLFYESGHSLIASKKLLYLLYYCSLVIHLCGAKKNKIHRDPGQ